MKFDVLIKGGTVIDPVHQTMEKQDVAVVRDRIATLDADIPADAGHRVIDATGQYVTPGLIDLHAHVHWRVRPSAVNADVIAPRVGVTTWLDAGSMGPETVEGLREYVVRPSTVRILSFLRIGRGAFLLRDLEERDIGLMQHVVNQNRDLVLGIKISMGQSTIVPMEIARRAADLCELPLMVHIAQTPPEVEPILALMRPGDIVTHAFTGQTMHIVDEAGNLRDGVRRAWESGVIFDIGHGAGSFSWLTAEPLMANGHKPDTISTDSWQVSVRGPMFDLPTCLSKFLHLGMSLPEVIRAATSRPAEVLRLPDGIGTLRPGAPADLALFRLETGQFPLYDSFAVERMANRLLHNTLTIRGGRPLQHRADEPDGAWLEWAQNTNVDENPQGGLRSEMRAFQQELVRRGHVPSMMAAEARRAAKQ